MRKNEEVTLPRTGCGDGCVINGHGIGQQCGEKESKTCQKTITIEQGKSKKIVVKNKKKKKQNTNLPHQTKN